MKTAAAGDDEVEGKILDKGYFLFVVSGCYCNVNLILQNLIHTSNLVSSQEMEVNHLSQPRKVDDDDFFEMEEFLMDLSVSICDLARER